MPTSARLLLLAAALLTGCAASALSTNAGAIDGAWRSRVQFDSGDFAAVHDLEFLYAFNGTQDGGTLTESSNYDAAPPVTPAYGVWWRTGPRSFLARYTFFTTRPPASLDEITKGNGWSPAGRGELTESITLSARGDDFSSTLTLQLFNTAGNAIPNSTSTAHGAAQRIH